jgi:hypothetical protein
VSGNSCLAFRISQQRVTSSFCGTKRSLILSATGPPADRRRLTRLSDHVHLLRGRNLLDRARQAHLRNKAIMLKYSMSSANSVRGSAVVLAVSVDPPIATLCDIQRAYAVQAQLNVDGKILVECLPQLLGEECRGPAFRIFV